MFNCEECEVTFGPGVKPIRVIQYTRPVQYHNEYVAEDEYGNMQRHVVDSVGTEIVKERLLCAEDAERYHGIPQPKPAAAKKPVYKFEEPMPSPLKSALIATVVHNALDRVQQKQRRAEADSKIAIPLIKAFVDTNKDFVF